MFSIPMPKPSGEILESGINNVLKNMMEKRRLAADQQYRQQQMDISKGQLGISQQKLGLENKLQPFREMLLKAQAEQAAAKTEVSKADLKALQHYLKRIGYLKENNSSLNESPENAATTISNNENENDKSLSAGIAESKNISGKKENTSTSISSPPSLASNIGKEPYRQFMEDAFMAKRLNMGKIDIVDVDGVQTAMSPISGPIPLVKGVSDWDKKLHAEDAKLVGEWGHAITAAHDMQPNLDAIQEIITSPTMDSMKQHPEFFGHDMAWFKQFGTPEQQDMVGNLATYTGELYTNMGQKFKGQFRVGEQALVKELKPDSKDTMGVLIGKTRALQAITQIVSRRLSAADKLVRSGKYTPAEALEKADKMVNGKEIRLQIKKQIDEQRKENSLVEVIGPNNETRTGPRKNVEKFLQKNTGWRLK